MELRNNIVLLIVSAVLMLLSTGCHPSDRYDLIHSATPEYEVSNFYGENDLGDKMRRVAVLPIYNEVHYGERMEEYDRIFVDELCGYGCFEVVPISRQEIRGVLGVESVDSLRGVPVELLEYLHEEYMADGVVFVDMTYYRPYMPISMSVRSKLMDIRSGRVVWSIDEHFDSGDPQVAKGATLHEACHHKTGYPHDCYGTVMNSPRLFSKYVAHTVFSTLPEKKI